MQFWRPGNKENQDVDLGEQGKMLIFFFRGTREQVHPGRASSLGSWAFILDMGRSSKRDINSARSGAKGDDLGMSFRSSIN